jgi:hypothetical protein
LGYKWEIPITFITCNDLKTVNQRWLRTHDDHIELTFPSGPFFTQSKIVRVLLVALGQGDHIGRFFFLLGITMGIFHHKSIPKIWLLFSTGTKICINFDTKRDWVMFWAIFFRH